MRLFLPSALLLSLLLCSCAPRPSGGDGNDFPADNDFPSDTAATNDTTAAADSIERPPPPPGETPPPGSARVRAAAASCAPADDRSSYYRCALRINRIEAYGSATPRIERGRTLQARLSEHTLARADAQARAALLEGEGSVRLMLRHTGERPGGPSAGAPAWNVARIY